MRKLSVVAAGALSLSSTMFAMDVEPFVGAELGSSKIGLKTNVHNTTQGYEISKTTSHSATAFGLRGGAVIDNKHRLALSLSSVHYDSDFVVTPSATYIVASYDYLHKISGRSKLFGGAHLANASYKIDTEDLPSLNFHRLLLVSKWDISMS